MMKRNRGRFTTILAVSGEKLPGSVVFSPTAASLSPRCICRRQRSPITPGTLRVPWAVFCTYKKQQAPQKRYLLFCKDVAKKMLASIFDGASNPHIGKTLKKRMSVNSVFRRTSGCLQIRQRGSNCIDFIFSFSILNLFGLLVQIKSTVLRLAKPHKYRVYKKHHLSTTTRGP